MSAATAALNGGTKKETKPADITRDEFLEKSGHLPIEINGVPCVMEVKEFSTGSFGWNFTGKINVKVGNKLLPCQGGFNLTVCGSKLV